MVSIRLMRLGAKKKPFYRVVVIDSKRPRESKAKEILGYYDPLQEPPDIKIDMGRANYWLERGARASHTVRALIDEMSKSSEHSKNNP